LQDKIIKVGTDGSLNKEKEISSFSWLLLGKKQKLVDEPRPIDGIAEFLSSTRQNYLALLLQTNFSITS
jgi:hypothetical protein